MRILTLDYREAHPWAYRVRSETERTRFRCEGCRISEEYYEGSADVEVQDGAKWTDRIGGDGAGRARLIISDRVLEGLLEYGITGFRAYPVSFSKISSARLRKLSRPNYHILTVEQGIEFEQSFRADIPNEWLCPNCKALKREAPQEYRDFIYNEIQWQRRLTPILNSWSGLDIFRGHNGPAGFYCSEKVLELAHERGWTNFRFNMIDATTRHTAWWAGIDYLSKAWPPERWYPPAPSDGKTMVEWLTLLRSEPYPGPAVESQARKVYEALPDFEEAPVPELWRMVAEGNEDQRKNAATALQWLRRQVGIRLTDDERQRILAVRPDMPPSLLR